MFIEVCHNTAFELCLVHADFFNLADNLFVDVLSLCLQRLYVVVEVLEMSIDLCDVLVFEHLLFLKTGFPLHANLKSLADGKSYCR